MDGWNLTPQGYTRHAWHIYQADTWCVALRADVERMVGRGFASPEDAASYVRTVSAAGCTHERAVLAEREACAKVADGFGTDPAELAHPCDIASAIRARK